jgi:DNA polymerase III, epsilon subunit and related 3''-5'' exonucleases
MAGPRTLVVDIETAPILARVWRTFKENVGLNQIEHDWYILSYSAKWLGEKKVFYQDQSKAADIEDDRALLTGLYGFLDEADIVVAHNGRRFDVPKINARLITLGFKPPSPYKVHDTLDIAKKNFKFTSNRLEFLTSTLCTEKKMLHGKFPGFELWKQCMQGNQAAWREMKKYNIQDVKSLEELYLKLRAWDPRGPVAGVYDDLDIPACSKCGSHHVHRRGTYRTQVGEYQRYQCLDCGGWSRGGSLINSRAKRATILRNAG